MGTGLDPTMDRKIPTTLWKTQLLKLVSEAPKAVCVEYDDGQFQRFPSSSSDDSDQSVQSSGSEFNNNNKINNSPKNGAIDVNGIGDGVGDMSLGLGLGLGFGLGLADTSSDLVGMMGCMTMTTNSNSHSHSHSPHCNCNNCTSLSLSTTAWDEPSSGCYNPFGKAFHGYLTHSQTLQLLTKDGHFLVRKRDNDDDFVLSFRFNGHTKNFRVSCDDTSGLLYVGDQSKPYESIQELVQEGMITLYLDMKAGSYIDLMCDLTHFNNEHQNNHHSNNSRSNGHLLTTNGIGGRHYNHSKQNSPSPSVSSLSRSSMERQRNPDLRTHSFHIHTFEGLSRCQICQNFMWGLSGQGLQCKDCGFSIHEACAEKVLNECEPRLSELPAIFGTDLTTLVKAAGGSKPPFVIEKCITEIEQRGLNIEGIYRVSGSRELTERLKSYLEQERESADMSQYADIHCMCGLVKLYLRSLPNPLITPEVFQKFLTASGPLTLDMIRRHVNKLPQAHQISLKFLLQHLHRVAEHSDKNKMNAFNLSSVFTPSVLCPSQISLSTLKIGTNTLEMMITHVPNLYSKT